MGTERDQSLAQNVLAREAANELLELGITLGKETGLPVEKVRHYWAVVAELAANLVGDELLCDRCRNPMVQKEIFPSRGESHPQGETLNDDSPFPFGKHKDKRCGDVPDDYLVWFGRQSWCDEWPSVLEYMEAM